MGLYPGYGLNAAEEVRRHTYAAFAVLAMLAIFAVGFHVSGMLSPLVLGLFFSGLLTLVPFTRYLTKRALKKVGMWGKPIIIFGSGQNEGRVREHVAKLLQEKWELGYDPVAVIDCRLPHPAPVERSPEGSHASKNTEFELFITQQPNKPFGISWYQADFTTNNQGQGEVRARGIFSEELFAVAPRVVKAPLVDKFDTEKNPEFKPVHTFHLGLWFGSPQEAKDAGCSGKVTPFDGDHSAGIQAFSTRNIPKLEGPLGEIQ
jgi:hypothetical protein